MEKGFSIVYKDNKIVKSVNELKPNDKVSIKLIDGSKNAVIMEE
jgi:exodeoxyribonuclease VII large subunit